jgi:SAM-dependent methyltransferase
MPTENKIAHEDNPRSIKYHVKNYLTRIGARIQGKTVVDVPAGNGVTSRIIKDLKGVPLAFDLFPEYFTAPGITCARANVMEGIPLADGAADMVVSQEGIEHFTDQFKAFKEFNRLLKPNGSLILTTPNHSNLGARLSHFLAESESFNSMMPPNEIDSVWMSDKNISDDIYFGHVFLLGAQKLRLLAKLSGFKIKHIQFTRIKGASMLMLPFAYPFIFLSNCIAYFKNIRKDKNCDEAFKRGVYREVFWLGVNPRILVDGHLFVEFVKVRNSAEVAGELKGVHDGFGET